jgi:hypothetical protein
MVNTKMILLERQLHEYKFYIFKYTGCPKKLEHFRAKKIQHLPQILGKSTVVCMVGTKCFCRRENQGIVTDY